MSDSPSLDDFFRTLYPIIGPAEEFVEQCCQPIAGGFTECHTLGFGRDFAPSREQLDRRYRQIQVCRALTEMLSAL